MRIAEIAPPWVTVPPAGYGGIELVVALLADGLVERGHDVTLFASGGSTSKAQIVSPLPEPPERARLGNSWDETYHATSAYLATQDGGFDVIHDHSGIVGPALATCFGAARDRRPRRDRLLVLEVRRPRRRRRPGRRGLPGPMPGTRGRPLRG